MIGTAQEIVQWLFNQDKEKRFKIQEHKEKRSLDANAYYWQLVTEIGNVVRANKHDIHKTMLKRYGQRKYISCLEDVDIAEFGVRYFERQNTFEFNGRTFVSYLVYKGSSEMNTREMAILIDGVISEAKELGIETLPPDELKALKTAWNVSNR